MALDSCVLQCENAEIADGKEKSIHGADADSSSWSLASGLFVTRSTEAGSSSYSGKSLRKQMLKRCHLGSTQQIFVSKSSDQIFKNFRPFESPPKSEKFRNRSLPNCLDLNKVVFAGAAAPPSCHSDDVVSGANRCKINEIKNATGLNSSNYPALKEPKNSSRPSILSPVEVDHEPRNLSESEQRCSSGERVSILEDMVGFGALHLSNKIFQKMSKTSLSRDISCSYRPEKWGWVVVAASWIILIPIVGVFSSFGIFLPSLLAEFNATKFEAGWIGSLVYGVTVGFCPFSNVLIAIYGSRCITFIGIIGAAVSIFASSFVTVLPLMFLTYSFMLGIFTNLVYNSAIILTGRYFLYKHQALATCLASSGISFGGFIYNPLSRKLVEILDWRITFRIYAGVVLVVGIVCASSFRQPVASDKEKETRNLPKQNKVEPTIKENHRSSKELPLSITREPSAIDDVKQIFDISSCDCSFCSHPAFICWMIGTLLWSSALLFPFIFLIDYMGTIGIPASKGVFVLSAFGFADFGGRLLCAVFGGKIPFSFAYLYSISAVVYGVGTVVAPFGRNLAAMYTFAIVSGINAGIVNCLMFVATMEFFNFQIGRQVWGYINVMLAMGMIGGPVVTGAIYDITQSYDFAFYVVGSLLLLCSVVMAAIPSALRWMPLKKLSPEEEYPTKEKGRITNTKSDLAASVMQLIKRHPRLDKTKTATDKKSNVETKNFGDVDNTANDVRNNKSDVTNYEGVINSKNNDVGSSNCNVTKVRSPQEKDLNDNV